MDFDKAARSAEAVLRVNPDDTVTRLLLAQTLEARGRVDEAIGVAMEAADRAKDTPTPYLLVAQMQQRHNRLADAEASYRRALEVIQQGRGSHRELNYVDKWMLSRLQKHVADANEAMEELKVRKTIHSALYNLEADMDWYRRRVEGDMAKPERAEAVKYVEWKALDTQVRLLAPFIPHLCEEVWEAMGGEGFVSFAEWPTPEEELVDLASEEGKSIRTFDLGVKK